MYRTDSGCRAAPISWHLSGGLGAIDSSPRMFSLETIVYPQNADVSYTYYGGSSLRAKVIDSAGTSKYAYNLLRQMSAYTAPQPANRTVTYTYNALGEKTTAWLKDVKNGSSLRLQ